MRSSLKSARMGRLERTRMNNFYETVVAGGFSASLDFMIKGGGDLFAVSFFARNSETIKAINAAVFQNALVYVKGTNVRDLYISPRGKYRAKVARIENGTDPFYHSVVYHIDDAGAEGNTEVYLTTRRRAEDDFFSYIMEKTPFPLLEEWKPFIWDMAKRERFVYTLDDIGDHIFYRGADSKGTLRLFGSEETDPRDLLLVRPYLSNILNEKNGLMVKISEAIKLKKLEMGAGTPKPVLEDGIDAYVEHYGADIVAPLKKQLAPLTPLDGECHNFTVVDKALYPQQLAMVNAVVGLFNGGEGNKRERRKFSSRYAILNEGMGSGKTLQAAAMCEAYAVEKELRKNEGRKVSEKVSLKDIYSDPKRIKYRNVVMCPGHLVQKWAREIEEQIPYAKAIIVDDFNKLVNLKKLGPKRTGREFFVMSKDFAKLSYQERPIPSVIKKGWVYDRKCKVCGKNVSGTSCSCGCHKYEFERSDEVVKGLACPECGRVLLRYGQVKKYDLYPLTPADFTERRDSNSYCIYCGTPLWEPHVKNIDTSGEQEEPKTSKWVRITHWANKAKKGSKTVWMLKNHIDEYLKAVGSEELNRIDKDGVRKYSPAQYIKKQLKGFFDIAVFDEMHLYKSGSSAQGAAMHALCVASERQLGLTGTIAGGYASDLFYSLFRLDPRRMISRGYEWTSEMKFTEKYGTLEMSVKTDELDRRYGKSSRSKAMASGGRKKPGISPLIFIDFLLDRTVFLDITDMSKYIPELDEKVVLVHGDEDVMQSYRHVVDLLKDQQQSLGMGILATTLQFSLSYLDKPYDVDPILDPFTGRELVKPESHPEFKDEDTLLPKEEALLEILKTELAEGRNCFVYAEYTASPQTCVTERLQAIIAKGCGLKKDEVQILRSESPEASKREEWIQDKAVNGAKVVITNPRCVETGLDFCFTREGTYYNYPTIVFYQMGYSLQTIWQAAHRHFRLNQTENCRTYYMAYEGTMQQAVISIIAKKMTATAAIQGKFSGEGLAAMAEGVDTKVLLAKALSDKEMGGLEDNLQEMFDVKAAANGDDSFKDVEKMKVFKDVVGRDYEAYVDTPKPAIKVKGVKIMPKVVKPVKPALESKAKVISMEENTKAVAENTGKDIWDFFFEEQVEQTVETNIKVVKIAVSAAKKEKKKSKKEMKLSLLEEMGTLF